MPGKCVKCSRILKRKKILRYFYLQDACKKPLAARSHIYLDTYHYKIFKHMEEDFTQGLRNIFVLNSSSIMITKKQCKLCVF